MQHAADADYSLTASSLLHPTVTQSPAPYGFFAVAGFAVDFADESLCSDFIAALADFLCVFFFAGVADATFVGVADVTFAVAGVAGVAFGGVACCAPAPAKAITDASTAML